MIVKLRHFFSSCGPLQQQTEWVSLYATLTEMQRAELGYKDFPELQGSGGTRCNGSVITQVRSRRNYFWSRTERSLIGMQWKFLQVGQTTWLTVVVEGWEGLKARNAKAWGNAPNVTVSKSLSAEGAT